MPRTSADDRLRRILAVVPWVVSSDGPLIAEVCDRFGYGSEAELQADFELLFLCGVHPFTPDALITVDLADGRVWVRYADYFSRPLRLSPAEALSLLASSAGLLGTDGHDANGPLARGLAKLASALGVDPEEVVDVELGPAPPAVLALLRQAVAQHRQVELDYYGFGRDARSTRIVDPALVYSAQGQWYLAGYCHQALDERLFRVDRIEAVRLQESTFTPRAAADPLSVYEPRPSDPRIVLDLEPESAWVSEQYPVEAVSALGGGRLRVSLAVSGAAWLERLLLQLGPTATVVEGDPGPARDAAARVLARYAAAVIPAP
jgi:proteasome accessory factor C